MVDNIPNQSTDSDTKHRILIVGCGDIGSRHLQAVASIPGVREIEVVDPSPESLQLGRDRLEEVNDRNPSIAYRWLSSLDNATSGGGLCILATRAEGRGRLFRDVVENLGYSSFILEKIVEQSVDDMEGLMRFSGERGVAAWVNFKTRAYRFHQLVKSKSDPSEPVTLKTIGSNHGLATNGIHSVDLFAFYDGGSLIQSAGSQVDPVLHPSKRGDSVFDLSGVLRGRSENGGQLSVEFSQDPGFWAHTTIETSKYSWTVDHLSRKAFESDTKSPNSKREIPFDGPILISEMTRDFARDILESGTCKLPTLEESMVSHRFIFGELQPHFSKLLGREIDRCPVT
jgi:predicted dehydrogenase